MVVDKALIGDFIDAAVQDQPKAIRLLQQYPELRNARWIHQETVLHFLAVEGYAEAVRFLGRLGFDANAVNEFGDAPLIDVAALGNEEVAEVLLEIGADPNARSEGCDTVLHCAVSSGNARLVDILLRAGAKADYLTPLGETVFDALPEDPGQRTTMLGVLRQHGVTEAS